MNCKAPHKFQVLYLLSYYPSNGPLLLKMATISEFQNSRSSNLSDTKMIAHNLKRKKKSLGVKESRQTSIICFNIGYC